MKNIVKRLLLSIFIAGAVVVLPQVPAYAAPVDKAYEACNASNKSPVCASTNDAEVNKIIQTIVNILLYVLGAIAVIMIVVGGIRYATSNGDASGIKSAKDTILYAVIGLVVAMLAWAIVNFVLEMF